VILGTVTDAMSGDPVHQAKIVVGGRSTIRYVDEDFQITNLEPGKYKLRVYAPGYESIIREVTVRRGKTRVDVTMTGVDIPGLDQIIVFAESVGERGVQLEIRLVNKAGTVIADFPRIPMTLDAELYIQHGTEESPARGDLAYAGAVDLWWDSDAFLGKIKGIIPRERIDVPAERTHGVLDVVLHTPQGDFMDTRANVMLGT
jgi:hypothetical protein